MSSADNIFKQFGPRSGPTLPSMQSVKSHAISSRNQDSALIAPARQKEPGELVHMKNIANFFYFIHKRNYMYQEQKLACASSEDSNESVDSHRLISFPPEETLDHCYMYP